MPGLGAGELQASQLHGVLCSHPARPIIGCTSTALYVHGRLQLLTHDDKDARASGIRVPLTLIYCLMMDALCAQVLGVGSTIQQ